MHCSPQQVTPLRQSFFLIMHTTKIVGNSNTVYCDIRCTLKWVASTQGRWKSTDFTLVAWEFDSFVSSILDVILQSWIDCS